MSTLHVIQYALVSTLYSRRLREPRLCPGPSGPRSPGRWSSSCVVRRAAAGAGGADHEANEVTERIGSAERQSAAPGPAPVTHQLPLTHFFSVFSKGPC